MSDLRIGLIGGTGLGEAMGAEAGARHERLDTPFGRPSGPIIESHRPGGVTTLVLARHGPGHLLNPSQVNYRANIFALKQLGCTHILASGAVGSLRDEFRPRDLVVPDQIIDKTTSRAGTFFDGAGVHVEFAEPFCPVLRQMLLEANKSYVEEAPSQANLGFGDEPITTAPKPPPSPPFKLHDLGCYVCMEGPAFSTRAESLMHRLWGGDLIGMTAMPEAKLAREAEIPYALVALVTDYDCWKQAAPTAPGTAGPKPAGADTGSTPADSAILLNEILANLKAVTANAVSLMRRTVELMATRRDELNNCPARHALRLAIWSDKSQIPPDERQRLAPLWMKYFD